MNIHIRHMKAIHGSTNKFLMIYEPSLADGETRDQYLERFARVNRPAWTFLTDDEWAKIDHHVTTCDYPETSAAWRELGRKAGFSTAREMFCDPTGFYRIYRYGCWTRRCATSMRQRCSAGANGSTRGSI